ncbi:hypothetical protein QNH20_24975 [Neobacillus sp. WH10]|nr:hypothetical protein [Neobacillus sp. WH10]WHY80224.1 hypothetical protein QNH20_24975 [Neobacillus sp. WH10]
MVPNRRPENGFRLYTRTQLVSSSGISQGSLYRAVNRKKLEEIKK